MATNSIVKRSGVEERQWVIEIGELLTREDLETAIESPAFIFELSDSIRNANPDAYIPHWIALGPHHHLRPELYKFQFYKLHMAKKAKEELQLPDFHQLHDQLMSFELKIRASFDSHLGISGQTLATIMLVDALFLLRLFLSISNEMQDYYTSPLLKLPLPNFDDRNLFHTVDEQLVAQFQILSDVLKLENQIPFLVIKGILPTNLSAKLPLSLYQFCRSVSPFDFDVHHRDPIIPAIFHQSHHLLHFIYFSILIFPKHPMFLPCLMLPPSPGISFIQKWLDVFGSVFNIVFIQQLSEAIDTIKELLELLGMVKDQTCSSSTSSPLIPSASQLQELQVNFSSVTTKGILDTRFIKYDHSSTLFLPAITVNAFTETLFKNLVAFEAMANINPPVLARYLELMKALIVTPKDLKILKDAAIINSHLESDEEVVKIFDVLGTVIATLNNDKPSLAKLNHLCRSNGSTSKSENESTLESESESETEIVELHRPLLREKKKKGILELGRFVLKTKIKIKIKKIRWSNGSTVKSELEAKKGIVEEIKEEYEEGLKVIVEEINQYYNSFWRVKAKRCMKEYLYSAMKILGILVLVSFIFLVLLRLFITSLTLFG